MNIASRIRILKKQIAALEALLASLTSPSNAATQTVKKAKEPRKTAIS